jgi:CelD/BcsL family acetyltransferase involved in cellulose biosynthesis
MMTEKATHTWIEKSTRLKLSLGGFLLHGVRFKALVLQGYYGSLGTDPGDPPAPLDEAPAETRCALINSHPIRDPLPRISYTGDCIRYIPAQYRRFYISLKGSFEEYLKHFSSSRRKHLKQIPRYWGEVQWREYRRPHEMAEFHRLARTISRKTYQEHVSDAGLADGQEFVDQLKERAGRDAVRGYILFREGKPVAYQYCRTEDDGVVLCEKVGYDPEYRSLSPGTMLLYLIVEHLFTTKCFERFDFGRGEFAYKETFSTDWIFCGDIYYFRRTFENYALVYGHTALDATWKAVAGLLDKIGLRNRLKRLVRRHYGQS